MAEVFHEREHFDAFLLIISEAGIRRPMRVIADCLRPDQFLAPRALAAGRRRPEPLDAPGSD
jgi:hypothetical protein